MRKKGWKDDRRETEMRRMLAVTVGTVAAIVALALPTQAKGAGGEINITKSGGGEPSLPITITGKDSFVWFEATGMGQTKFARPGVRLGPAYDVIATLDCGRDPGIIRQTLYPYAQGGVQVYTSGGQSYCGEMPLRAGWWSAPPDLLSTLESRGLEPPARAEPDTATVVTRASSRPNSPSNPLPPILMTLGALLAMVAAAGLVHRGRAVRA